MDSPSTLDYVTLGIAAVGAVTGVAALGATWAQFTLSGARVKVTSGTAMPTSTGVFVLYVNVENVGRMPVTVHGLGLALPNDAQIPLGMELARGRGIGPPLSHRIEAKDEQSWYFEVEPIVHTLLEEHFPTKLKAFAATGSKRNHARKPIDLVAVAKLNRRS